MDTTSYAICVEEIARVDGSIALTVASHNGLGTGHVLVVRERGAQAQVPAEGGDRRVARRLGADRAGERQRLGRRCARPRAATATTGSSTARRRSSRRGPSAASASCSRARTPTSPKQRGHHGVRRRARHARASRRPSTCSSSGAARATPRSSRSTDVRVADAQRVGEVDHGFADTMRILDRGRISIAAMALGLGYGALDMATRYAKERKAFGKPIADFQAIQWMLADAKTELDAAALLTYRAAWLADRRQAPLARRPRWPSSSRARRDARLQQRPPGPRRLRLRARVRRRASPPRREALRDRRGHERGAAHGHREARPDALKRTRAPLRRSAAARHPLAGRVFEAAARAFARRPAFSQTARAPSIAHPLPSKTRPRLRRHRPRQP